jgi:hypothetical protein
MFGRAQTASTDIQISGTVVQSSVSRLGVNLSGGTYWDSGRMMKNLIFENPGFEGLDYREIFQCARGTADSCEDNNQWNAQPAGFWNGGSYRVMSGSSAGATGTVVSSTAAGSCAACGPEFQFDKSLGLASGDYFSVEVHVAGSGDAGWTETVSGGGAVSTETTDLSPETPGRQALLLSAGRAGQSAAVSQGFTDLQGLSSIQLNGTFQLTFKAKGVGGNNQLNLYVGRLSAGAAPYLSRTVMLTDTWRDYALSFSADETVPELGPLQLSFTAAGANAELDDVSLAQADSDSTNPTVFRDDALNALKELAPGTIRTMAGGANFGSDLLNQLEAPFARYREGFSAYGTTNPGFAYGIQEVLQLCSAVGADPWIVIPTATTPQEITDFIEYLTGDGSDPWSRLRIARSQIAPWTSVFGKVHIELGDETWNGSLSGESMGYPAYPQWANEVFGAARQTPGFEAANFDLILSGSASSPGYNAPMLTYSTQHDSFDIAPHLLLSANNEAQAKLFGALFAEPELFDSAGGEVFRNMEVGASAPSATAQFTNVDVSETNLSPIEGSITQEKLNRLTPSVGAGIAQTEHMLQMMRIGAKYQNAAALPRQEFNRGDGSSVTLLGGAADMETADRHGLQFLTQALANRAIGGEMLETVQSGANPTWNQPPSSDHVELNGAHYLQSFAFQNGSSAFVIVFNLNQTAALPVTFSGAKAPVGTVRMTQIASARITDDNETSAAVQPTEQTLSRFNPAAGLLLPPFSMTLLNWTSDGVQAPILSVPGGTYSAVQTVTLSSATAGAAIYYTADGSAPTSASNLYTSPIAVGSTETLQAIAVLGGSAVSPVASAAYTIDLPEAAPILSAASRTEISAHADAQPGTQTTVTISNNVQTANIDRPGVNLGGLAPYGPSQLFKSLVYSNGGYMPGTYFETTYPCSAGTQSTTVWHNDITDAQGYPANFWVGASFTAINTSNGTSYGSGNITSSTTNIGSSGINFTLSPAISAPCTPSRNDVLIVKLTAPNTLLSPNQALGNAICSGATWDTTDTSPASTNTIQSLEMPTGCQVSFGPDAVLGNNTNTNATLAAQQAPWLNLNGSYTLTFKAKCLAPGCSISYVMGRNGGANFVPYGTISPSYSATPGAGWTTYTYPFTASETGAQGSGLYYNISCTGTCLLQDMDVIESSTLAGNTTVFRDAVVYELEKIHPGSLRYMDGTQWCSDVADEIAATGNRRWCGGNDYLPQIGGPPIGYNDVLALANLIGSDAWISVGVLNQASDWTSLINWLNTSGWISTFAASGHRIYLEDGNEPWNTAAGVGLWEGNGSSYGYILGLNMAAAKAASGYNSSVIQLIGDSWVASNNGYGSYGWLALSMNAAGCTNGSQSGCPNLVDVAPYTLGYLENFDTSGSNVSTTGAPFLDEWAEISNLDSVTSPPANSTSVYLCQQYAKTNYGVNTAVYEVNEGTTQGTNSVSQLQLDQIDGSVGSALMLAEHMLLMARDSSVTGPINAFVLPNNGNQYNGANSPATPLYGMTRMMATGPGQTLGSANVDRPSSIALEIINNAIGPNNNLMSITQSGTPTFSYTASQILSGYGPTILGNSAVPYVNCFAYANNAQTNWTTICFNNNLSSAESVTLAGAGAPTGSVTQTVFPNSGNLITDHNENSYVGPSSLTPVVVSPSPTTASGTIYSIPSASMIVLNYSVGSVGSPPNLAAPTFSPGTGTYSGTQTVTINFPAGSTGCVGINTIPTAPTLGTCGSGGTTYTGPITVSTSETVNAIATEAGNTNSAPATATYTITVPTVATPTFSPAAGAYTSSQSVTISDATAGATIYYTTNGSVPTTSSTVYSGPITVSSSETLEAIAVETGYTTSAPAIAAYTITVPTVAAPTFSPAAGIYTTPQSVTISDATAGATIYYTTNGSVPTTGSAVYSGPITVSSSETLEAIAVKAGYNASAPAIAAYTLNSVLPAPVFSPAGGAYSSAQLVTISDAAGTTIYYTTNRSVPTTSSAVYSGPITVSASETLEAIAVKTGYTTSAPAIAVYVITITVPSVEAPTFSPAAGTYTTSQSVTISDATVGATIYYTTDGSVPSTSSAAYSGPITVSASETLEAIAVETGYANSATAIAAYTINVPQAAAPTFSPPGGTYSSAQLVTISDATPGVTIYYTTDRTTPTMNSTVYSGPISVSTSETVEAIAAAGGTSTENSAVAMAGYTLNLPTPSFTIALSSASLDITPGQSGTTTVIVTPENSFASPITFSCSGLPVGATCSFSPATLTPSSPTAVTTMTITTSTTTAALRWNPSPLFPASSLAVALCLLGRKRKRGLLLLVLVSLGLGMCTGCGGVVPESQPTSQSTVSTVTVTATGGSLQPTATLTLTLN